MIFDEKSREIINVLHEDINISKNKIINDAIKIYAYLYGNHKEGYEIIIKKDNEESKILFEDFLKE
jgi:hypothetical protein